MEVRQILKQVLSLLAINAKLDLVWLLRDTKYALAAILADTISSISVVSSIYLIAIRFGGIGAMSINEILFMMAYSTLVTGLFILFGSGNNIHISRMIGRGQLEHLFMQPHSLKMQLITSGFVPFTGSSNFLIGCALLSVAIHQLQLTITLWWVVRLIAYLISTLVIIVARAYLVSTVAFYAPVAAEEVSSTVIDGTWQLSTFPLSGMPGFIQIPLMTILPQGLMAWFPALCLLGKRPLNFSEYYPLAYAFGLTLIASLVFKKGLNYYVKKGSNRYVPYGFRR